MRGRGRPLGLGSRVSRACHRPRHASPLVAPAAPQPRVASQTPAPYVVIFLAATSGPFCGRFRSCDSLSIASCTRFGRSFSPPSLPRRQLRASAQSGVCHTHKCVSVHVRDEICIGPPFRLLSGVRSDFPGGRCESCAPLTLNSSSISEKSKQTWSPCAGRLKARVDAACSFQTLPEESSHDPSGRGGSSDSSVTTCSAISSLYGICERHRFCARPLLPTPLLARSFHALAPAQMSVSSDPLRVRLYSRHLLDGKGRRAGNRVPIFYLYLQLGEGPSEFVVRQGNTVTEPQPLPEEWKHEKANRFFAVRIVSRILRVFLSRSSVWRHRRRGTLTQCGSPCPRETAKRKNLTASTSF